MDHPDDDVTDAQRAYTAAFVDWFRSRSEIDHRRRENALERMLMESQTSDGQEAA